MARTARAQKALGFDHYQRRSGERVQIRDTRTFAALDGSLGRQKRDPLLRTAGSDRGDVDRGRGPALLSYVLDALYLRNRRGEFAAQTDEQISHAEPGLLSKFRAWLGRLDQPHAQRHRRHPRRFSKTRGCGARAVY